MRPHFALSVGNVFEVEPEVMVDRIANRSKTDQGYFARESHLCRKRGFHVQNGQLAGKKGAKTLLVARGPGAKGQNGSDSMFGQKSGKFI